MKKILLKTAIITLYVLALLWLVDFKLFMLINLKMIGMVLFGTSLLTLAIYKRGLDLGQALVAARWNAQITGYLTTFFLEFALLSSDYKAETLMYEVAMNLRPLLYALLLNILFTNLLERRAITNKENDQELIDKEPIESSDLVTLLTDYNLTEREIAVVQGILEDLSNKEIGEKLYISENTVKKHIYNLFKKLEIRNREQLKQLICRRNNK